MLYSLQRICSLSSESKSFTSDKKTVPVERALKTYSVFPKIELYFLVVMVDLKSVPSVFQPLYLQHKMLEQVLLAEGFQVGMLKAMSE